MSHAWYLLRLFISDFNKQRKKIGLTVMAIAWGTVSIILLLSFGEGLKRQLVAGTAGMGKGIVVVWGGQTKKAFKGLPPGRRIRLKPEDIELVKHRIPSLEDAGGEYQRWGVAISHGKKVISRHLTGVTPSYEELRHHYPQQGGRFINQTDLDLKRRVAFIGSAIAKELFGEEEAVGKIMMINNIPFTVIGVMIEKNQMGMYSGPDEEKVVIPLTTFGMMLGDTILDVFIYKPAKMEDSERVKREILRVLGGKYKFDPEDEAALWMWDTIETTKEMRAITLGVQIFLGVIGGLTLLVAGVGVANIMYVTVRRRTKEIGIKMAMGAKARYILVEFIIEALLIGVLGGFFGFLLAGVMVRGIGILIDSISQMVSEDVAEAIAFLGKPVISVDIAVITALILLTIGFWAGFFPSRKAAKINPAESLRYE
ncbi:MAG: FtsX-like permease family protein [candidate division Zixibacteria bacterium]|nr:FtsX-like permease family protein [candidate division Zixibacteria bacterium]